VREPPPLSVKQRGLVVLQGPGGTWAPLVVLIEHTVLSTVAVKLPLLCAQTAEELKSATAEMARQESITLVIVELFFIIIFLLYCCAALKDRNGWLMMAPP
jgi:hypothetical protein